MTQRLYQVDAFTDVPFAGNPAGVCILDAPRPEAWMQQVAAELNASETAFLLPEGGGFRLRWFTPTVEVDLCGHATLASAHVLYELGRVEPGAVLRFFTRSGELLARREGEAIVLDFPSDPPAPRAPPAELLAALGAAPRTVALGRFDWLVELDDAAAVRRVQPDLRRLAGASERGVIVTAASDAPGADFVSRFFGPAVGVDEDPVTGSAHCTLGPFWAARLGKDTLTGRQLSARGGVVGVRLRGERVDLIGRAVTVLEAQLLA